jgi:hypothetical protein
VPFARGFPDRQSRSWLCSSEAARRSRVRLVVIAALLTAGWRLGPIPATPAQMILTRPTTTSSKPKTTSTTPAADLTSLKTMRTTSEERRALAHNRAAPLTGDAVMPGGHAPRFPYGPCACHGPAAYSVVRAGKPVRVCTRCVHPTDLGRCLLVCPTDSLEPFFLHDPRGALCLLHMLTERMGRSQTWGRPRHRPTRRRTV